LYLYLIDINPKKVGKYLPSSLVKIASKDEFFLRRAMLIYYSFPIPYIKRR